MASTSLPINKADFIIAYGAAFERWRARGYPWPGYKGDPDAARVKECIEDGMDAVREMRGVKRLPPGASKLREQVRAAFKERKDRMKRHDRFANNDTGYKWAWQRQGVRTRWTAALQYHYERVILSRMHEIRRACPWMEACRAVSLEVRNPGSYGREDVAGEIASGGWRLAITVERELARTAILDGIVIVAGQVVLGATQCHAFKLPLGVAAVYDVTYIPKQEVKVQKYSGRELDIDEGVVIVPEDHPAFFAHSRESAIYGALCAAAKTSHYRKSRRGSR